MWKRSRIFIAHCSEESLERFDGSLFAYPEQTGDADIDLIGQRQVLVALRVLDFIDTDGVDSAKRPDALDPR
jgi:hypothetical protein